MAPPSNRSRSLYRHPWSIASTLLGLITITWLVYAYSSSANPRQPFDEAVTPEHRHICPSEVKRVAIVGRSISEFL